MSRICAICASPNNVENAHIDPKKMGGRGPKAPEGADETRPLCAGSGGNTEPATCHGANEAGFLALGLTADGHLRYRSTRALEADNSQARTAKAALTKRGVKLDGNWHTAAYEDTDPDAIDALPDEEPDGLGELEVALRSLDAYEGSAYHDKALYLTEALTLWQERYGPKDGWERFKGWRRENLGMGDAVASRLLTVGRFLPSVPAGFPATYQYHLARAVKLGKGEAEDLTALAGIMPQLDFLEQFDMLPSPRKETTLCCPSCAYEGPQSRFRGLQQ